MPFFGGGVKWTTEICSAMIIPVILKKPERQALILTAFLPILKIKRAVKKPNVRESARKGY